MLPRVETTQFPASYCCTVVSSVISISHALEINLNINHPRISSTITLIAVVIEETIRTLSQSVRFVMPGLQRHALCHLPTFLRSTKRLSNARLFEFIPPSGIMGYHWNVAKRTAATR